MTFTFSSFVGKQSVTSYSAGKTTGAGVWKQRRRILMYGLVLACEG